MDGDEAEEPLHRGLVEDGLVVGKERQAGFGRKTEPGDGAGDEVADGAEFDRARDHRFEPVLPEPEDERDVRGGWVELFAAGPGVRQVGADEDEVAMAVAADMVADEALAGGVEREGEFELGVVVPLERDGVVEPAVEHAPRGLGRQLQMFEKGPHRAHPASGTPE